MQPVLEEILYSALEDYKLDIIIGQGPSARTQGEHQCGLNCASHDRSPSKVGKGPFNERDS
jgi:hypothetical protein